MAFVDYYNEVLGHFPGMDPLLSRKLVNRSWRDIRESRLWSFNVAETVLNAPAILQTGSVSVTQFSTTVTGNAAASTAWQGLGLNIPITTRQFRVGSGPLYSITAFDNTSALTLDRNYVEATASGQGYSIYKCYYAVPSTNFLRWISILDPSNAYQFNSTSVNKEQLDRIDPQRASTGLPYYLSSYKPDANNNMQYEMWPHPTSSIGYISLYEVRGSDFSAATDALPPAIPEEVLLERALYHGCLWYAKSDLTRSRPGAVSGWIAMSREHNANYRVQLLKASRQDEETYLSNYANRGVRRSTPGINTGAFMATHDVGDIFGDWM